MAVAVYIKKWKEKEDSWSEYLEELLKREADFPQEQAVEVRRDAYGKPYLPDSRGICFNVSHSGDYLAIAIGTEELGIDLQEHRSFKSSIFRKVLQPQEKEIFTETKEDFFRCWTLKESLIKALGQGFRIPLNDYYFRRETQKDGSRSFRAVYRGEELPFYFYIEETVLPGYTAALCSREREISWHLEQEGNNGRTGDRACSMRLETLSN